MSPEMLTLVAAVLAYDFALDTCDAVSVRTLSLKVRSDTREEKDMVNCVRMEERMLRLKL